MPTSNAGAGLSLVLPAWNEADVIATAVQEALAALSTVAAAAKLGNFEVIIVDDGSTDQTAAIVRAINDPRVRLIEQGTNQGYGAALRAGFEAAQYELVSFTDADCQFDLTDLAYMVPLSGRYDLVYGYRIDRKDLPRRRFASWGYNQLIRVLLGSPVRDVDCALKVFRRRQLPAILPEARGFFANTEMIYKAGQQGLSVVEVGVTHRPRTLGQSTVRLSDIPKTLASLLPFWWSNAVVAPTAEPQGASAEARGAVALRHFWPALAVLMVLAGGLLFPRLGYPLLEPDESRYAEVAREMFATGEVLVPTLNGRPYYDKPPLLYWVTAGSYALFGVSEAAARLIPALAMVLTILGTFVFAWRSLGTRTAFLGAAILTLSVGGLISGRFLSFDALLSLCVAYSLFLAFTAMQGATLRWGWFAASALCCGAGIMTKGPVAVALLLPPVVAYGWLERRTAAPTLRQWIGYFAIAGAVALPWFAAICISDPGFARYFFWEHNVQRFLAGSNHPEPLWFYLPVLLVSFLPWSLLAIPLVRSLLSRSVETRAGRPAAFGFSLLWAIWCTAFFSASKGKLPAYILPALPAIAVLLGQTLDRVLAVALSRAGAYRASLAGRLSAATVCWVALGVGVLACLTGVWDVRFGGPIVMVWAFCLLGLGLLWWRTTPGMAWGLCGVFMASFAMQGLQSLLPEFAARRSLLAGSPEVVQTLVQTNDPVACWGGELASVPFAVGGKKVQNLSPQGLPGLTSFLREHHRAYLLLKSDVPASLLEPALPPGARLSVQADQVGGPKFPGATRGRLYLIEHAPARTAAVESATVQ